RRSRIRRTPEFEDKAVDQQYEKIVELSIAVGHGFVAADADEVNAVRIEVPLRGLYRAGRFGISVDQVQRRVRVGGICLFKPIEKIQPELVFRARTGGGKTAPVRQLTALLPLSRMPG